MKVLEALARVGSESEFAAMVGITQPRVAQFVADGVLPVGGTLRVWLEAYCARLREQAAGRMGNGALNVADENAALARSRREAQDLKNAVARGDYAPVQLLTEVLANASKMIGDELDALPVKIGRACPDFTHEQRELLATHIANARNQWADMTLSLNNASDQNAPLALAELGEEERRLNDEQR